jgi:hypothetical protein
MTEKSVIKDIQNILDNFEENTPFIILTAALGLKPSDLIGTRFTIFDYPKDTPDTALKKYLDQVEDMQDYGFRMMKADIGHVVVKYFPNRQSKPWPTEKEIDKYRRKSPNAAELVKAFKGKSPKQIPIAPRPRPRGAIKIR